VDIIIPDLSESVREGDIGAWLKADGDRVEKDELILELETDKATVELAAEASGQLEILVQAGEMVTVGDVVGRITEEEGGAPREKAREPAAEGAPEAEPEVPAEEVVVEETPAVEPASESEAVTTPIELVSPPVREPSAADEPGTRRERMTRLRRRVAERLVEAQRTAAILTTFNEIDMSGVLELRTDYRERFESQHGVRLGFMSFFARAVILGLRDIPELNAYIEEDEIVYHDFVHLGIAVGTPRGLVVPVVRNADRMSFAEIETEVKRLGARARDGQIAVEDLQGGTFTISNGGIYGSLLSTPILNPPQSGILGMHKIQKRSIVLEDDTIVVRPMMYVALSYDHRIVDGEEAVTFLVRIKERLEDPARLLLDS
jgi:2-oxoglutarate dehydrogenase E2 component (dihydrolipoamide succinyltransferase)